MNLKINLTLDINEYIPLEGNIFYVIVTTNKVQHKFIITLENDDIHLGRIKSIIKYISQYTGIDNTTLYVYKNEDDNVILMNVEENIVIEIFEVKTQIFDINLIK